METRDVDVVDISSGIPKKIEKKINPRSPTSVTNAVPRPSSTRSPGPRPVTPDRIKDSFLAAERFPRSHPIAGGNIARTRSAFTTCSQGTTDASRLHTENGHRDSPDDAWTMNSCSTPTRRDIQDIIKRVKEVQAKAVAVTSETKCGEPSSQTAPRIIKVPLKPGRQTTATKEAEQQQEPTLPLPPTFESCLRNFAETGTLLCREECAVGEQRGDDREFFANFGETESAPDKNRMATSVSSISTKSQKSPEQGLRSTRGAMRFPEAISIVESPKLDGRERSISAPTRQIRERPKRKKRGQGRDRTAVSPTMEIVNGGEDPESMRQLRLQLFKKDNESMTVPKARLSRALGELVLQDGTIDSIQAELYRTKAQLKEAQREIHRQKSSTPTIKNTSDLYGKLKKRKELNVKLRAKVTDLEIQVNHLRAELSRSKTESEKLVARLRNRQDELQAQLEVTNAKLKVKSSPNIDRPPESPKVVELRADIVNLRSQLAEARQAARKSQDAERDISKESQLVALRAKLNRSERELEEHRSKTAGIPELVRLKTRLERVEKELELERLSKASPNVRDISDGRVESAPTTGGLSEILRLRTKLHHAEKELTQAKENSENAVAAKTSREEKLSNELKETQRLLTEQEATSRTKIEELMVRVSTADREIAEGRTLAKHEVSASREEAKKLQAQVEDLKKQLACERGEHVLHDELSSYNRKELERELRESRTTEKTLKSLVDSLIKRVDDAESKAKEVRLTDEKSIPTLFVGEKAESTSQANAVEDEQLNKSKPASTKTSQVEDSRVKMLESQNGSLQNELLVLRARLADSETKRKEERLTANDATTEGFRKETESRILKVHFEE